MRTVANQITDWCREHQPRNCTTDLKKETPFHMINIEWQNRLTLWKEIAPFIKNELLIDQFYPDEIPLNSTIEQLSEYLTTKLTAETVDPDAGLTNNEPDSPAADRKIEQPTVFILGCPRSGTTLFRTMLTGHPEVNAPPELHLLGHGDSLKSRERNIVDKKQMWRLAGVVQTLAHQLDMTEDEAFAYLSILTRKNVSIKRIYELIHSTSKKSILVDKTPDYSKRIHTLKQTEEIFNNPRYLFIHRHPGAVMESWLRMKDKAVWGNNFLNGDYQTRLKFAENKWLTINTNIVEFLKTKPTDRHFTISYESLVKDTKSTMTSVAKFLNIPFDTAMLSPYSGERLTHGLGDPNFTSHNDVDPTLIDSWRSRVKVTSLSDETVKMAIKLGYNISECH